MNYRVVIHSIDLQDREGFLAFLDAYARKGYEAVRIFRSFTVFRKTETCETNNHPLCGCASIVIQKITFPV